MQNYIFLFIKVFSRSLNFNIALFLILAIIEFENFDKVSIWRVLLSILFPPLAVIDKGCGSILIVLLLTFAGWVPGVVAALVILNNPKS
jgi:uncharacterized membrane protein YqaE (UPF0057 family)